MLSPALVLAASAVASGCPDGEAERAASARSVSATRESTTGVGVVEVGPLPVGFDHASCMASWK